MLKKLIVIENGEEVQCDTLQELVEILIDKNFYKMSEVEQKHKMEMKALANCINNKMEIVQDFPQNSNLEGKFVIKDESTYILSLLITNKIILLERKDSNFFTRDLSKENIKDNYIIVNTFAKKLLANLSNV